MVVEYHGQWIRTIYLPLFLCWPPLGFSATQRAHNRTDTHSPQHALQPVSSVSDLFPSISIWYVIIIIARSDICFGFLYSFLCLISCVRASESFTYLPLKGARSRESNLKMRKNCSNCRSVFSSLFSLHVRCTQVERELGLSKCVVSFVARFSIDTHTHRHTHTYTQMKYQIIFFFIVAGWVLSSM